MGIWNNLASLAEGVLNGPTEEQRRKQDWQDQNPGVIFENDNGAPWSTEPKDADEHEQTIAAAQQFGIPVERSNVRENQAMANSVPNASLKRIFNLNGDGEKDPRDAYQPVADFDMQNPEPMKRGVVDDGQPLGGGMMSEEPKQSRTQELMDDIRTQSAMPAEEYTSRKKKSFLDRFGGKLWRGYKAWDPNKTGWSGGIDALAGGFEAGFDPKVDAEDRKQRKIGKVWNNLAEEAQLQSIQQKQAQEGIKTATDITKLTQERMKPFVDAALRKGYLTDDEVAHIKANGVDITDPNNPEFVEREVNGKWMIRYKNDSDYRTNTTLPEDTANVPLNTTITTGGESVTLPLKPGQAANMVVQAADRAERTAQLVQRRNDEIAEKDYRDTKEYQGDLRSYEKDIAKAKGQKAKATAALPTLKESKASLVAQQLDTTVIDRQIAEFEGDIAEADELMKLRKPERVQRKKSGGKLTVKGSEINALIQKNIDGNK